MPASPNYVAGGNISPARFVKHSGTNFTVTQAGLNEPVVGVSQEGTRRAPGTPYDDGLAAIAGESLQVHSDGEECLITLGGTVVEGDYVGSDASGRAIAVNIGTASATHYIAGKMLEGGVSGEKRRMLVGPFVFKVA